MKEVKALKVTCPIDGEEAEVTAGDDNRSYSCSHASACISCVSRCGARAVLTDQSRAQRLRIVCPSDGSMARIEVKAGKLTYCSHSKDMPECGQSCIRPAQP